MNPAVNASRRLADTSRTTPRIDSVASARGAFGRGAARLVVGLVATVCFLAFGLLGAGAQVSPRPPAEALGALYADVEVAGIFPDSKTFADAVPRRRPSDILSDYRRGLSPSDLLAFVHSNFDLPVDATAPAPSMMRPPLKAHIAALWPVLARPPLSPPPNSTQLPLDHPYVVPGGRFREVYYWDSYFTLLGLVQDSRKDLAQGLVDNFADLINRYGHVPNGARSYYLSRSQPPVFYLMVGLLSPGDPAASYARYLPALRREHRFWMEGEDKAGRDHQVEHVVRLHDGAVLNRYWDASDTPRDEAFKEDVALAASSGRPAPELYREIRSAAESGWDFSSRWMADGRSLASLETTSILPVDLNSLLFGLEGAITEGCVRMKDKACADEFSGRAERRKHAIARYFWDDGRGAYLDFNWRTRMTLDRPSAAMLYPLFVGAASKERARQVATLVRGRLLAPGGLLTTAVDTHQQWDAPNGWAPLQWIAVSGLKRFGEDGLAHDIATRWIATVCRTYLETGKLLEKYDVMEARPGGGGEYPLQDGFGWTNGVTRALLSDYPPAASASNDCSRQSPPDIVR